MRLNRHGLGTGHSRSRVLLAVALLMAVGTVCLGIGSGLRQAPSSAGGSPVPPASLFASSQPAAGVHAIQAYYARLPLAFEPNQGQSDPRVQFLARGQGYGLFLTAGEAVLALRHSALSTQHSALRRSTLRMSVVGANGESAVTGADVLPGKSNYIIGNDPSKWHRGIPQFARVRYREVYPGIDLVYYGNQGRLEYDFEVAPGADPKPVALRFQGQDHLKLDTNGDLVLAIGGSDVRLHAPRVYQRIGEEERLVAGSFVLQAENRVGFELGPYDRSRVLVIDPVLSYSTYLGGTGDESCSAITGAVASGCPAIAVDSGLNAYIAGSTTSIDFPIPTGSTPFQMCLDYPSNPDPCPNDIAASDAFIAKFNSNGSALLFATYLGGTGAETTAGIAVDSGFNVVVAGTTDSPDFPTSSGAFQATPLSSGNHVFVSKLDAAGENLLYSTYLSGSNGADAASGMALDVRGKVYVTGTTTSSDYPTANAGLTATCCGPSADSEFFVSKIDPATSSAASLPYSTYFGGGNPSDAQTIGGGITVDANSNVYITGGTSFLNTQNNPDTDFPILNAAQACLDDPTNTSSCPTNVTATDIFVAKINPTAAAGGQLLYSTYLGGSGDDVGTGIAVDTGSNVYATGSTNSEDVPIPTGTTPFQRCLDTPINPDPADPCPTGLTALDAFVAKLNSPNSGTSVSMTYFSYLGGTGDDTGLATVADSSQGARLTGWTDSADFRIQAATQGSSGGGTDAFAARIDTTATADDAPGHFSTYLGGGGTDRGAAIALDTQGASYIAGETDSGNFPTLNPFQGALSGGSDAFVSKLGASVNLAMTATATPDPIGVGNQVTFKFIITNSGDLTPGITFNDVLPANATFVSATPNCTNASGTVTCAVGTLNANATATITVILTPTVAGAFGNSGNVTVLGNSFTTSASASTTVNDYSVSVSPATRTVQAGVPADYTVTVTPTGAIPNSVSLSCSAGLPSESRCEFTNNPITNFNNGSAQSRALVINTTARPRQTALLRSIGGPTYATWLPVSGLVLLGLGIGGKMSRKRRILEGLFFGGFLALILFQAGCGSSSSSPAPTGGTPAGDYTITITATSGSATRTTSLELVVQ